MINDQLTAQISPKEFKFKKLSRLLALLIPLATYANVAIAQTADQANVIENSIALKIAESVCGYKVDKPSLGLLLRAMDLRPEYLSPGGKYWPVVERSQASLRKLTATKEGQSRFCRNVRNDLSSMFD